MKKLIRDLSVALLIALLVLINLSCAVGHHYGELRGQLVDATNDQPIMGAAVAAVYYVEKGTVGGQVDEYVDAIETTSGADGRFLLPAKWVWSPRLPFSGMASLPRLYIFAPGFESVFIWRGQAESKGDATNVPVGVNTYGTLSRPIVTVVTNTQGIIYQYRLSRLESAAARELDLSSITIYQPSLVAGKMTNFIKAVNSERQKYGWRDLYIR